MKSLKLLFLSFLLLQTQAYSEDLPQEDHSEEIIFNNEWDNVFAPFTNRSSLILLTGLGATYFVFKDNFQERLNERPYREDKKIWRTVGDAMGWGALPIGYVGLMAFNYYSSEEKKPDYLRNIEYIGKSVAYTALMTLTLKLTINQQRPDDELKRDSFPSGHASSSFAFSTAVWLRHGHAWGAASTLLASWITFSRIDDGSHFYHDSVFGATLGISYAVGIYYNHFRDDLPFVFSFSPTPDAQGLQSNLVFSF